MKSTFKYKVIGIMSGTSLDGLDIVYCEFRQLHNKWVFNLKASNTIKYSPIWAQKLSSAHLLAGLDLQLLDKEFGVFIGSNCKRFIQQHRIKKVDFIASHGHTIFHQTEKKFTFQLGSGVAINQASDLPVINDFRSLDVLKGGQGAPLVPIGDHHLFSEFDVCLNLGGIANLSMLKQKQRIAYDICFANMGLNHLAGKMNKRFDKNGIEASRGIVNKKMLEGLNGIYQFWRIKKPSLGREGFEKYFLPIIDDDNILPQNRLRTFCESICDEIALEIPESKRKVKLLATGGGALNRFLITLLQNKLIGKAEVIVPGNNIVNFKEAIVFGFLGVLRLRGETNVLRSVTGGSTDSSAGSMIGF